MNKQRFEKSMVSQPLLLTFEAAFASFVTLVVFGIAFGMVVFGSGFTTFSDVWEVVYIARQNLLHELIGASTSFFYRGLNWTHNRLIVCILFIFDFLLASYRYIYRLGSLR